MQIKISLPLLLIEWQFYMFHLLFPAILHTPTITAEWCWLELLLLVANKRRLAHF